MSKTKSAPGLLELVRVFANTLDPESGRDVLREGPDRVEAWFAQRGHPATIPPSPGYEDLWALRDAVRQALEAHTHAAVSAAAWQRIRSYAQAAELRLDVEGSDRVRLTGVGSGLAGFAGEILARIYDAIRDGSWQRLKLCRESTCAYAFYDSSKNGSGVWCDMAVCGNRNKARRRRAKPPKSGG